MMRKIFKYISVFSLWVAGLTLSAHFMLPHDHHLADSFSKQDNNCSASHNRSGQKSGLPVHCHAFNDLATEKSRPIQILQNIKLSLVTFSILNDTFALELQSTCLSPVDFSKPIPDSYYLDFSQLRAPPSFTL